MLTDSPGFNKLFTASHCTSFQQELRLYHELGEAWALGGKVYFQHTR